MPETKYTITFEDDTCKGCPILDIDNGYLMCPALRRQVGFGSWIKGKIRCDEFTLDRLTACPIEAKAEKQK